MLILASVTAVASGDLSVDADILNIAADGDLREGRFIAGGDATIAANGSVSLTSDALTLTAGRILAQGGLTVTGASLTNGSELEGKTLTLDALTGALVNRGVVLSGGPLLATGAMALQGATGTEAARIVNRDGGLIETFVGDIYLAALVLQNLGPEVAITEETTVDQMDWVVLNPGGARSDTKKDCHHLRLMTDTTTESAAQTGEASMIVSADDLVLTGGDFVNRYSLVSAAGDIALELDSFTNTGLDLQKTVIVTENHSREVKGGIFDDTDWYYWDVIHPAVVTDAGRAFATIEAGGDIAGVISGYVTNGAVSDNGPLIATGVNPDLSATGLAMANLVGSAGNVTGRPSGIIGNPALFVTTTDPNATYLVETRYQFIDLERFMSSDALLSHFLGSSARRFGPRISRFGPKTLPALA